MKKERIRSIGLAFLLLLLFLCKDKLVSACFSPEGMRNRAIPAAAYAMSALAEDEAAGENRIIFDVVEVDYSVDAQILFELLETEPAEEAPVSKEKPTVLIYHTHATEAYLPTAQEPYKETSRWRTNEAEHSVIAVGEVLAEGLRAEGFTVIHDTANYEPPLLSTAYERSLAGMEEYKRKYPDIDLFIDLHRDAYELEEGATAEDYANINDTVTVNDEVCARLMFVVGTGEGAFDERPDYQSNYALALGLTEYLEQLQEGFTRPIRVKTGRYNQHMGTCLLVEVGHNANTLQEAKNAAKYLAMAIAQRQ